MVVIALSLALVFWLERRVATWHLGLVSYLALFATLHLFLANRVVALNLAFALVATIGLTSKTKHRFVGTNLMAGDVLYLAKDHLGQVLVRYRRLSGTFIGAVVALWLAAIAASVSFDPTPVALAARAGLFGFAGILYFLVYLSSDAPARLRSQILGNNRGHLSGFVASLFGIGPSRRPSFIDIDNDPLPLLPAVAGVDRGRGRLPHIVMILHESTFDPVQLDLPSEPDFDRFFRPPDGVSGILQVDVFGGGTAQTEMAVYSGLSSLCFGAHGNFVFRHFSHRLRHTLPGVLAGLGYRTRLVSSDEPRVTSGDIFYRSIGFQEIDYPALLPPPFDIGRWQGESHDEQIFDHVLARLEADRTEAPPLFVSAMTYMNHGSHAARILPEDCQMRLREETMASSGNPEYAEYMVRLAESVRSYAEFRKRLDSALGGDPAIIVRFGDHQPSFVSQFTGRPASDPALRRTFYAFEAVNCSLPTGFAAPAVLDATFLSTLAMVAAGLPLDPVNATRLSLLEECGTGYFASASRRKCRFHRSLLEHGHVDLG